MKDIFIESFIIDNDSIISMAWSINTLQDLNQKSIFFLVIFSYLIVSVSCQADSTAGILELINDLVESINDFF